MKNRTLSDLNYANRHKARVKESKLHWRENNLMRCNEAQKKRYSERQQFLNWLKAQPCKDCGKEFPSVCMDFDHRNGAEKVKGVSEMFSYSWNKWRMEILKCDLVCSNCHRIRTANRTTIRRQEFLAA